MLDVHPPHEKIHGFRDFLLHLLTITIGLLIALGLEALVERVHQNHLRAEAEQNVKHEIEDNRREVANTRALLAGEEQNLVAILRYMRARAANKPYEIHDMSIKFAMGTLKDASWSTAAATGALALMDYQEVKKFEAAYQDQLQFEAVEREVLNDVLQLQSYVLYDFDPLTFPPAEAEVAERDVRLALSHLHAVDQIGRGLDRTFASAAQ